MWTVISGHLLQGGALDGGGGGGGGVPNVVLFFLCVYVLPVSLCSA